MDDLERLIQVLIDFGRRNTPVFRLKWTFPAGTAPAQTAVDLERTWIR
jgi:hypothetical protein